MQLGIKNQIVKMEVGKYKLVLNEKYVLLNAQHLKYSPLTSMQK